MTRITKKKKAEKEIRKAKQTKEWFIRKVTYNQEVYAQRLKEYEKIWPKSRQIWTQLILTVLYYIIIATFKLVVLFVLLLIKYNIV